MVSLLHCVPLLTGQGVFDDADEKAVVSYYTTCDGDNVFVQTLSTAYLQASLAQEILAAVDSDSFEEECPDQVRPLKTSNGFGLVIPLPISPSIPPSITRGS